MTQILRFTFGFISSYVDAECRIRSYNLKFEVNKNQSKTIQAKRIFFQIRFLRRESNIPKQEPKHTHFSNSLSLRRNLVK